jgi:hypothetical protein
MWFKDGWGFTRTGWALALISGLLLVLSLGNGLEAIQFLLWGVETQGQVIAVRQETKHGPKGGTYIAYFPKVSFVDQQGAICEMDVSREEMSKRQVGSRVPVLYLPDDPRSFYINDGSVWSASTGYLCLAFFFLIAGIVSILLGRQWR